MARKPIDVEALTQRKVTVPLVLIVGLVVLGFKADNLTVGYLGEFFLEKAVAEEQYKQITEAVASNAKLITGHIRTYELNENARDTRRVQEKLSDLDLYVAANGSNEIVTVRRAELQTELGRLGRVRACIIRNANDENCASII
jgi:hypothetical protein